MGVCIKMQLPYKVLVLDDDKLVTSSLKSLLMLEGFTDVVYFNSPKEALDYLNENSRDVIISDFKMPEMTGLEFLTEARKLHPNASMILLTGYADKEDAIKIINEVGLYKYIERKSRLGVCLSLLFYYNTNMRLFNKISF